MKKAQLNSEILKWILMIVIFAVIVIVLITLQSDLPETVRGIIEKATKII